MHTETLTTEQIQSYRENGYLVVPDVLSADELDDLRAAVDEAYSMRLEGHDLSGRNERYDQTFLQKVNLWQVIPGIRAHTFSPKLAGLARQLTGADSVRLWHDQVLVKPPHGLPSPYHQDLPYWPMLEDGALTCWTPLDDVTVANGCMHFVPRSHTWGKYAGVDLAGEEELARHVPGHAHELTPFPAEIPAGSVTFHHSLTFHGASANSTDNPRRAMIVHYMPDATHFNGQDHIVTDGLSLKPGDALADDALWPVLSQAA